MEDKSQRGDKITVRAVLRHTKKFFFLAAQANSFLSFNVFRILSIFWVQYGIELTISEAYHVV